MAYYFLFPEIDSTLYSHPNRSEMNAGGDEILEIVKERGNSDQILYPSRVLIKFKNEEIQNLISDIIGHSKFNLGTSASLNLTSAEPINLIQTLNLEVFAVSQSWDEGTGRYSNLPTSSNGCSWKFRNNTIKKDEWSTDNFGTGGGTGSVVSSSLITAGGGTWYTGSDFRSSQQFLAGTSLDTNFDVTNIVKKHSASLFNGSLYPTGIFNNGFLIKKPDSVEMNVSHSFGQLQYFSVDTHTIHPPKLIFKWDDSVHTLQSSAKQSGELNVSLYRNREEYNQNDEAIFRIHVRDKYPTRQFTSTSNFLDVGYFTTSSFYSIRDAYSEQEIIPFDDDFTKLSADSEGMFFKLFMKGLQPERYYRILFKHKNQDGTRVYDDNYLFKVVR
jgi:hypothetical protein